MTTPRRRKAFLMIDADALDCARELDLNVSAVAEAGLVKAIAEARQKTWLSENADAFAAKADWHGRNGHPLADIITTSGA